MKCTVCFYFIGLLTLISCLSQGHSDILEDDKKIDALLESFKENRYQNPDTVIRALYQLQPEMNDSVGYYRVVQSISELHGRAGNLDSAFLLGRKVLDFCSKGEFSSRLAFVEASAANTIGVCFHHMDMRDSAIFYLSKSYDLLYTISNRQRLPDICINLADSYEMNGNYPLSGFYYRRALFLSDSLGIKDSYYAIYSGMGRLYQQIDNFNLSDEYFVKAEAYWSEGDAYEQYFFANSRGNYYYNTKDYTQALKWFREAYRISNTFQQTTPNAIVETNLGEIFILLKQPDSARIYLDRSRISWDESYKQPSVKFYIDGLYASLALLENDIVNAEKILLQKYDTTVIIPSYLYSHNRRLQQLYELKNDYKKAYQYKIRADVYNDSLRNVKVQNNIAEIDFRYQQDTTVLKKDLQIAEVEIKASRWKYTTFGSIFIFIIILLVIGGIYVYRKRLRELKYRKQLDQIAGLRMEIIRNRISPHFTFNVINTMMPALGEYKELEQPFRLLVQMLRTNLRASEKISVSLGEEINLVKTYLELYMVSHPGRIKVEWTVSEDVPMLTLIPSMSLQIPVENAVKYAFPEPIESPRITITISRKDNGVEVIIIDNGVGFNSSTRHSNEKGTGNGLRMLYHTTELLNTRNAQKMVFKIQNKDKDALGQSGTRVFLFVPFNYKFEL